MTSSKHLCKGLVTAGIQFIAWSLIFRLQEVTGYPKREARHWAHFSARPSLDESPSQSKAEVPYRNSVVPLQAATLFRLAFMIMWYEQLFYKLILILSICLNVNGITGNYVKTSLLEGNCLEKWSSLRLQKLVPSETESENFLPNTYSACNRIPGQCARERTCKTLESDRRNTTCVQIADRAVYECSQLYTCLVRVCLWSEIEDGQYYIEILTVDELNGQLDRNDSVKEHPKLEEQLVLASYLIRAEIMASLIEVSSFHSNEENAEASGKLSLWALALVIGIPTLVFLVAMTVLLLLLYRRYRFSYQTSNQQLFPAADLM
ncbi:hypothetical protein CRM22_003668 [Opisthorchis felineus]|uniref:Uncharacterized protein n=1 Tax=Opisthorchis felineus TaxID=147828 RepID=A0A4S2M041_OPIFE|nr:hypothetical protein CRM22_003668 [Opisthorchis felineus]